MATLADVKAGKKRGKTFVGRPQSVASGISLPKKRQLIRRSEVLLDDQLVAVRDLQDTLEKSMQKLADARSKEDFDFYKTQVEDLKLKCEEMVLVLQVIGKLNRELAYARLEFDRAQRGEGDQAATRKRLVWLEDRVENLLTKHKRNGPRLSESRVTLSDETESYYYSGSQQLQSDTQTGSEQELMNNQLDQSQRSTSSIQFVKNIDNADDFADEDITQQDLTLSRASSKTAKSEIEQFDRVSHPQTPEISATIPDVVPVESKPQEETKRRRKRMKKRREIGAGDAPAVSPGLSTEDEEERPIMPKSILKRPQSRGDGDGREEDAKSEDSRPSRVNVYSSPEGSKHPGYKRGYTEASVYPARSVTTSDGEYSEPIESDEETVEGDDKAKDKDGEGVFITETPGDTFPSERASRQVAVISPKDSTAEPSRSSSVKTFDPQELEDAASKYWKSDHHQFEFTENMEAILSVDPLSYHSMGLAIPSTFTQSLEGYSTTLPWRQRRKGSDLPDVHDLFQPKRSSLNEQLLLEKIALDALAKKIHKMWDRVEDAAIASTAFKTPEPLGVREATFLSNVGTSLSQRPSPSKQTPSSQKGKRSKHSSPAKTPMGESPSLLPPIDTPREARSRLLEYHPKPIPPPEVLPLTRTNVNKKYPRVSYEWNDVPREDNEPTLRIVNQMNVAKETNILAYKSKEKKRKMLLTPVSTRETSSKAGSVNRDRKCDVPDQQASEMVAMLNGINQKTVKLNQDTLKWKRVNAILDKLYSDRVDERIDAAKHLGTLRVNNDDVLLGLKEKVMMDSDLRVKYEASKSLITLGFHDEPAVKVIVANLLHGSEAIRQDLLETLMNAKDIQYIDPEMVAYAQLVVVLKGLCQLRDESNSIAFNAAICLGCLGVRDPLATDTLLNSLDSKDSRITAKSLEILVRQMYNSDRRVIQAVLRQLEKSSAWKHRASAAKLLVYIGPHDVCDPACVDEVFAILEHRLWNDPNKEVRKEIANTMVSLGMRDWIWEVVEKKLEDDDDDIRAQGALAVGVLGMKTDKIIRMLLEMLELDSSEFVRLHIIRTFAQLGMTDIKIMRSLRERERTEGPLAREASKSLKVLSEIRAQQLPRSPSRSPLKSPSPNLSRNMLGI
ncbi:uncharacterized protein [Ptychodera flava]|uniref:uncharacterized protein isoform X2 n=1 Tax=Ptychodera flava TaxID=63121 RepID=UPI003969D2C9